MSDYVLPLLKPFRSSPYPQVLLSPVNSHYPQDFISYKSLLHTPCSGHTGPLPPLGKHQHVPISGIFFIFVPFSWKHPPVSINLTPWLAYSSTDISLLTSEFQHGTRSPHPALLNWFCVTNFPQKHLPCFNFSTAITTSIIQNRSLLIYVDPPMKVKGL